VYLHQVLEAKLLGPGDLTLSIGSVFILIVPDCGEGNRREREDSGQEQEKRHDPPVC